MAASQGFCGACGSALRGAGLGETTAPFRAAPAAVATGGERRQLTILFVDIVGSTRLATRLDPEEYRDLIDSYRVIVSAAVKRRGGLVNLLLGDGLLASFGFPRAHEDDAVQAVAAAFELIDGLEEAGGHALPPVRVAVATGIVVVEYVVGDSGRREPAIFGDTPNLAARLQELAPPGGVVVCPTTRKLIDQRFSCGAPTLHTLKGFTAPVAVSSVEAEQAPAARPHGPWGDLPIVGRDEEIGLLRRRWRAAAAGEGRVVVLAGEPGIGKSRAVEALRRALSHERHGLVTLFGSAHHANSALFPVIAHLERAAGFQRGDDTAAKADKLARLLGGVPGRDDEAFNLVAHLLALPGTEDAAAGGPPQAQKRRTFEVLLDRLERFALEAPVLFVVEDAHWFDPTSLELLALIVERVARLPVLVVVTARPEFCAPWPQLAHVATTTLTRLDARDGAALVVQAAGGRALPPAVVDEILKRTDGVPLFVEELTKAVLESGRLGERDGSLVLDRPLDAVDIPATLQASLRARLDRLGAARKLAQIGAAVGRNFHFEVVRAVAAELGIDVAAALGELERSALVFRHGEPPEAVFTFKHALVRDAAYAGLLKSGRRRLHGAIARALFAAFPEIERNEPETLAHHLAEAGDLAAAAPHWLRAGRAAAAASANLEAIAHLRRGLEAVAMLPAGRVRDRLELDLLYALGPCLIATQGPAAADAVAAFEAARVVGVRLGAPPELQQIMFWIATASVIRGELEKADEAVAALLAIADGADGDRPALLNAWRGRAMILLFMGHLAEAEAAVERFLTLFDASSPEAQLGARAAGQDAKASGLALASWIYGLQGDERKAFVASHAAVVRADEVGHPHSQAYVAYYAAVLASLDGRLDEARAHAGRCLGLAEAHGFAQWRGLAEAVAGIVAVRAGRAPAASLAAVIDGLGAYRRSGYQLGITALYAMLCPVLLDEGQSEAAVDLLDDGLAIGERNGERAFEAELLRLSARPPELGVSERARRLTRAHDLARAQGAGLVERRCRADHQDLGLAEADTPAGTSATR